MPETIAIYYRLHSPFCREGYYDILSRGYDPAKDELAKVADLPVGDLPDLTKGLEELDQVYGKRLNFAWRQMNHVDGTEWIHNKKHRSMSVGDVVVIGKQAFSCDPDGWSQTKLGKVLTPQEVQQ
jgi:hypothetical protein